MVLTGEQLMLGAIGLRPLEERVYRLLVSRPAMSQGELAEVAGVSRHQLREALMSLESKGLASRSADRRAYFVPAPPDIAVEVLILRRQEELERARIGAQELLGAFRARVGKGSDQLVELLVGREAISQRVAQIERTAKREIRAVDKPPYMTRPGVNPIEIEVLGRGVRWQGIYSRESIELAGRLDAIRQLARAGEASRVLSVVPMKLLIADHSLGIIPLSITEPQADQSALLVHPSSLLDALAMLFDLLWERALPIRLGGEGSPSDRRDPDELSVDEERLLTMLIAGMKEQAIARQLGVVGRTVQRRIEALMRRVGANTRLQLGAHAARRGWV